MEQDQIFSLLGVNPESAKEKAFTRGLLSSIFQAAALSGPQARPVGGLQGLGQIGMAGFEGYESSMDRTLKEMLMNQQLTDAQRKRQQETKIQEALQLATPQAQIEALRKLGAYETIGGIAAAEKGLRQSGIMRQPGEMAAENPFSIYAQSEIPGVAKLGKQYQKAYETGAIDDEKATARLGELARMEDSAFARQESAADRRLSRDLAQGEREQKRLEGTEGQRLASGFADRMVKANAIIDQLETSGGLPTEFTSIAGGVPLFGSYLQRKAMTPEQQKYKQAADNWIRANLRKESGAVIGADEMEAEYNTYFPQPGDLPENIAQKAEARKTTTEAMIKNAGPVFSMPALGQRPRPADVRNRYNLEAPR